jgi:hypothetical protein
MFLELAISPTTTRQFPNDKAPTFGSLETFGTLKDAMVDMLWLWCLKLQAYEVRMCGVIVLPEEIELKRDRDPGVAIPSLRHLL